jgi:sulfate transporter 4
MQFYAQNQLHAQGSGAQNDIGELNFLEVNGEPVTIPALPEEQANACAAILHERHVRSNPMTAPLRALACTECSGNDSSQNKHLIKNKDLGPWGAVKSFMPILTWLPNLFRHTGIGKIMNSDVIAGVTVGVMLIPQSMSYANIAGLEYVYGMYSGLTPIIVYAMFGQSRQLAVGPVAMVSLLVEAGLNGMLTEEECPAYFNDNPTKQPQNEMCPDQYAKLAFLTALLNGIIQLLFRITKLSFLVSFLGHPVISGFTSGAAIIIALSQVKYLVGYKVPKSQYVFVTIGELVSKLDQTKVVTLILGILTIAFLMTIKKIARKVKKLWWLASLGPLTSCIIGILMLSLAVDFREDNDIKYVGEIPVGLPKMSTDWNFGDMNRVLPTAFSCAIIGFMESIAIGKSLASKHGYELESGQELLALGMSNIAGACFSCYPITGSFSRSAVNNAMGAKTAFSSLVTAVVMLMTLCFLAPIFHYLPKFVLAAIVINSVLPLIAYHECMHLWKVRKADCFLWIWAFLGTLFLGVLPGILNAVAWSLVIVVYESVRPQMTVLWRIPGTSIYRNVKQESSGVFIPGIFIVRIGSSLYFANSSYVKDMLFNYTMDLEDVNKVQYIIIEMTPVISIDSTAAMIIEDIIKDFRGRGIQVAFAMVGNRVEKTMRKAKLTKLLGTQWFFPTVHEGVQYCLQHQHARGKAIQHMQIEGSPKGAESLEDAIEDGLRSQKRATIQVGTEFGVSNSMHHLYTTVYFHTHVGMQNTLGDMTRLFAKNGLNIIRAQVENDGQRGFHTYWVQSARKLAKLTEEELERLRDDVKLLQDHRIDGSQSGQLYHQDSDRVVNLEQTLAEQSKATSDIQKTLLEQAEKLNSILESQARQAEMSTPAKQQLDFCTKL